MDKKRLQLLLPKTMSWDVSFILKKVEKLVKKYY